MCFRHILVSMKRKLLKDLRNDRHLTQLDVADRLHMPHQRYVRIENGYTSPSADERADLARLFRSTVAELFPERTRESVAS